MLNRAPSVYVPVEPEDNGLALPAILSLIVHGSILAFIFFSYQVPKIEDNQAIETSIVTPEQLANLQADIRANRESIAAGEIPVTPDINTAPPPPANQDNSYVGSDSAFSRGFSSIFSKSPDSIQEPVGVNETNSPVFTELDQLPELDPIDDLPNTNDAITDPKPQKPNTKIAVNSDNPGQLTATFPSGNEGKGKPSAPSGSPAKGGGDISGALVSLIEPLWTPPVGRIGASVSVSVSVDDNGNVVSVTANTSDQELKQSLESAVKSASPLSPVAGTNKRKLKLTFIVR